MLMIQLVRKINHLSNYYTDSLCEKWHPFHWIFVNVMFLSLFNRFSILEV
jgi:hypothetical protein